MSAQSVLSTEPNSSIAGALVRKRAKDCMGKDMTPEQWRGLVGGLLAFFGEESEEPEHAEDDEENEEKTAYELREMELENSMRGATDSALALALDKDSVREMDEDGRMRVKIANISKATVNPYRGKEIPGWEKLGLDPEKIYQMLRHPDELKKAADTANGVQILRKHIPVSAEDHQPWDVVGTTGTDAKFEHPHLRNSLHIWSKDAIDDINSDEKKELSMGYHYEPDMTPGKYDDMPYDGVMRDIRVNHVALVKDGRAGPDVVVGDSKEDLHMTPTKFAAKALFLTAGATAPFIAKDAKGIDLMPIFKDLTKKNFKAKDVSMALDSALKGKLAKDANMGHVAEMLDHLEHEGETPGEDESVSEPQHKAMEAAAHGSSTLGIPKAVGQEFSQADKGKTFDAEPIKNFLKEKGMSEDDMNAVMDMLPKEEMEGQDEDEEEKKKKEEEAKKAAEAKDAELKAKDAEMKDMVKKPAMDEAIKAAVKQARENEQGIRAALSQVRPYVGELPETLAFDSAADVKRHALTMLGFEGAKTVHADALDAVLSVQRKAGAQPVEHANIAMDSAQAKDFNSFFPGAERIGAA